MSFNMGEFVMQSGQVWLELFCALAMRAEFIFIFYTYIWSSGDGFACIVYDMWPSLTCAQPAVDRFVPNPYS